MKAVEKRHFYLSIDGMPEEVVFEPLNEFVSLVAVSVSKPRRRAAEALTIQGDVVDELVKEGNSVKARQVVLITEEVKMESR